MATIEEQEKLLATLKFTPRKYRISLWGYGGEIAMGTLDKKIFDYFKHRRLSVADFAWDYDYAEENNIPEEMWPFSPGSWYECDNLGHASGVERDSGTLQIDDENGDEVLQRSLESFDGGDGSVGWCCGDEAWVGQAGVGAVVFIGRSNEKGTFFEGEIELTQPFDIEKLELYYDEIDGSEVVTSVMYDGEDIDNYGGGTDGKSSDFGFYLIKEDDTWESYKDYDSITYPTTEWFPKKVKPTRVGNYEIQTTDKNPYTYHATWTGEKWVSAWTDESDYGKAEEVKVKQWRGIPYDPDLEGWDPVAELDKIIASSMDVHLDEALEEMKKEFESDEDPVACFSCGELHLESVLPELNGQLYCPDCKEGWVMAESREEKKADPRGWPF